MATFTQPIRYSNQDFDEYQAAVRQLGPDHVEWFCRQPVNVRRLRINGAWAANNSQNLAAYQAVERFRCRSEAIA